MALPSPPCTYSVASSRDTFKPLSITTLRAQTPSCVVSGDARGAPRYHAPRGAAHGHETAARRQDPAQASHAPERFVDFSGARLPCKQQAGRPEVRLRPAGRGLRHAARSSWQAIVGVRQAL